MSYPVWPSELPRPERNTWQRTPQDARLKRRSEAGPAGYKRRFSSASKTVALSIVVDRMRKGTFDRFFEETASQGAGLFWMPDPTTDGWGLLTGAGVPLLTDGDVPVLLVSLWLVTFGQNLPSEAVQDIEFRMSFSVEVMP